jgi:putative SOS response-associated peptidase YedK
MQDRMPVIVTLDKYEVWFDSGVTDFDAIRDILKPYDTDHAALSREHETQQFAVTLKTPTQSRLF